MAWHVPTDNSTWLKLRSLAAGAQGDKLRFSDFFCIGIPGRVVGKVGILGLNYGRRSAWCDWLGIPLYAWKLRASVFERKISRLFQSRCNTDCMLDAWRETQEKLPETKENTKGTHCFCSFVPCWKRPLLLFTFFLSLFNRFHFPSCRCLLHNCVLVRANK